MNIYCGGCNDHVNSTLLTGRDFYPQRKDLHSLYFWGCPHCNSFVGCHKTGNGKTPLGVLATKSMKKTRSEIHSKIDPIWKSKKISRSFLYKLISNKIGFKHHTASLKSDGECLVALDIANELAYVFSSSGDKKEELIKLGYIF